MRAVSCGWKLQRTAGKMDLLVVFTSFVLVWNILMFAANLVASLELNKFVKAVSTPCQSRRICASGKKKTWRVKNRPTVISHLIKSVVSAREVNNDDSWGNGEIVRKGLSRVARKQHALSFSVMSLSYFPSFPPSLCMLFGTAAMEIPDFHKNRAVLRDRPFVPSTPPICILRMYTYARTLAAHAVCHSFMHTLILAAAYSALTVGWQHVCVDVIQMEDRRAKTPTSSQQRQDKLPL